MNWKTGKVQWFDDISGRGMVLDPRKNKLYYVHYSAIRSDNKNKSLTKGCEVKFKVIESPYSAQVVDLKVIN